MAMEKYTIQPLTKDDLPTLAQFVFESKLPLTINRLLVKDWPNYDAQKAHCTATIEQNFQDPDAERFKIVQEDRDGSNDGEMVGHLVLTRRKGKDGKEQDKKGEEGEKEKEKKGVKEERKGPEHMNPEVLSAVMEALGKLAVPGDVEHLELTHLYISPAHRRRGLGSRLVELAKEKAKEAGVPLYLQSEPQARLLFLNGGLKDRVFADIDLAKFAGEKEGFGVFRLWGMRWEGRDT